jgi:menaquinone-dependent protoporphyrinogen IX oxidase
VKIEYVHASKYGNGAKVAEGFRCDMADAGVEVVVHHVDDVSPKQLAPADLYVFSSPGRMGRPIGSVRRLLKRLELPAGTRYALLTTEMAPQPDKKTGRVPTEEEICRFQHVRPIMHELLQAHGLVPVAEEKVYVLGLQGPLEDGWEQKVAAYAERVRNEMSAFTSS